MIPTGIIFIGLLGAVGFVLGWVLDPAKESIMVVALVCGTAGSIFQISVRELVARAQALVDRAIDRSIEDGGEFLDEARETRERVSKLGRALLMFSVLAPAFAAARGIYPEAWLSAFAFCFSTMAVSLSLLLQVAHREFNVCVETERQAKLLEQAAKAVVAARKHPVDLDTIAKQNPNLPDYTRSAISVDVIAPHTQSVKETSPAP